MRRAPLREPEVQRRHLEIRQRHLADTPLASIPLRRSDLALVTHIIEDPARKGRALRSGALSGCFRPKSAREPLCSRMFEGRKNAKPLLPSSLPGSALSALPYLVAGGPPTLGDAVRGLASGALRSSFWAASTSRDARPRGAWGLTGRAGRGRASTPTVTMCIGRARDGRYDARAEQ